MVKKSILKRASYFGSALILMLAMVPVVPNGRAWADEEGCVSELDAFNTALAGTDATVAFCDGASFGDGSAVTVNRDVTIDMHEGTLSGRFTVNGGNVLIKNGTVNGGGTSSAIHNYGATLTTLENMTVNGGAKYAVISDSDTTITSGIYNADDVAVRASDGTTTINGGTANGGVRTLASGAMIINGGTVNGGFTNEGTMTVTGGTFSANPSSFVEDGYDAYAYQGETGGDYWQVGPEATMTVKGGKVQIGQEVEVLRVSPAEFNTITTVVKRSGWDGPVKNDDVNFRYETDAATGEIVGYATGVNQGHKYITITNNSGVEEQIELYVYEVSGLTNPVIAKDATKTMEIASNKWNVGWSLTSGDESVATVAADGHTVEGVASGEVTITVHFEDDWNTTAAFTVYVYDFDDANDEILLGVGEEATLTTDSHWEAIPSGYDAGVATVDKVSTGEYKITGAGAGKTTATFTVEVNGEVMDKEATVHVYEVVPFDPVFVAVGSEIELPVNVTTDDETTYTTKSNKTDIATVDGLIATGVAAGKAKARGNFTVTGTNLKKKNVDLGVIYVYDFYTDIEAQYEQKAGDSVTFTATEANERGKVKVTTDSDKIEVVNNNDGTWTLNLADDITGGEYTVTIADKVAGTVVETRTAKIRVHEIVTTGEDEHYIVMTRNPFATSENRYDVNVSELSGFTANRDITATVNGSSLGGVTVQYRHGGNWRITAQEAGSYDVIFSDGVASKTIRVYVMQFTFGQDSYHVRREDGAAGALINAINNYWHEENVAEGYTDTEFVVVNDETGAEVASGYGVSKTLAPLPPEGEEYRFNWCLSDECLPAGNYTITFKAYANNKQGQATKSVRLHIYEMVVPQEDLRITYTGNSVDVDVYDLNDRASTRATIEVVEGEEDGLKFAKNGWGWFATTNYGRLNASKPGVYAVHYTDYMGNGAVVGTYDVTVVVIDVEYEELFVRKGSTVEITGSTAWTASFATDMMVGTDYVAEDGVITYDTTDMELGVHWVEVAHDFEEFDDGDFPPREVVKMAMVVVYDVNGVGGDDMTSDADRAAVADFVAEKIAGMIENDSTVDSQLTLGYYDDEGRYHNYDIDTLKALLMSGAEIETQLIVRLIEDEADWEYAEAYDEVVMKIEDENGIVAMYSAYLEIYANGEYMGTIYELDAPITMRLLIPEEYRAVASGYTRTFSVVRGHLAIDDTETAEVMEVTRDGDYLVFKNSKFSSFAMSYTDTLNPVTPNTGFVASEGESASASSLMAVIATLIGAITLAGAAVFAKRR